MDATLEVKKVLAWWVVADLNGRDAADAALDEWERRARGEDPTNIPDVTLETGGEWPLPRLLVALGMAPSTSESRRLIAQGGVNIGPERTLITNVHAKVEVEDGLVVRVGRRRITRIKIGGV